MQSQGHHFGLSILLENPQGKTRERRTQNNMSIHERANMICETTGLKWRGRRKTSEKSFNARSCHSYRHAHFPYGFSNKRKTDGSLTHMMQSQGHHFGLSISALFKLRICIHLRYFLLYINTHSFVVH